MPLSFSQVQLSEPSVGSCNSQYLQRDEKFITVPKPTNIFQKKVTAEKKNKISPNFLVRIARIRWNYGILYSE